MGERAPDTCPTPRRAVPSAFPSANGRLTRAPLLPLRAKLPSRTVAPAITARLADVTLNDGGASTRPLPHRAVHLPPIVATPPAPSSPPVLARFPKRILSDSQDPVGSLLGSGVGGHLLWTGTCPPEPGEQLADRMLLAVDRMLLAINRMLPSRCRPDAAQVLLAFRRPTDRPTPTNQQTPCPRHADCSSGRTVRPTSLQSVALRLTASLRLPQSARAPAPTLRSARVPSWPSAGTLSFSAGHSRPERSWRSTILRPWRSTTLTKPLLSLHKAARHHSLLQRSTPPVSWRTDGRLRARQCHVSTSL